MKIIRTVSDMKEARRLLPEPVGFVPTMGYLHEGHLSLVKKARTDNASVVVSIFVNPAQFGPQEDFANYPRDEKSDLSMLEKAGADIVLIPTPQEMYPQGFDSWVEVKGITERLEGAFRPSHFKGVATVCNKLFNIVRPDRAYFGQKDAQQVLVIKKMVANLNMNLEVAVVPTVREPGGLAMSSRNTYLRPDERRAATVLYRSLCLAEKMRQAGETSADAIRKAMTRMIQAEPTAHINYVSVADATTLEELEIIKPPALISLAVRIGKTRLIDNIILG